jgi:hypothetical protein
MYVCMYDCVSLELDAEHAYYASFTAPLANLIIDYESETLGPRYGLVLRELLNVATTTLPWVVQLRSSYDTISTMGEFSESNLVVLTNTLNQDLSDYDVPDVELVVSPVNNAVMPATQSTCLQLPTPAMLSLARKIAGATFNGVFRALFVPRSTLTSFCRPSPPDCMRVILVTGRGALALFFASHEFKLPSDCYMMAAHRCLALLRSGPLMFGSALGSMRLPESIVGLDLCGRYRAPLCRVNAPQPLCLWTTSPGARILGTPFSSTIGLSMCLTSSYLKRGY